MYISYTCTTALLVYIIKMLNCSEIGQEQFLQTMQTRPITCSYSLEQLRYMWQPFSQVTVGCIATTPLGSLCVKKEVHAYEKEARQDFKSRREDARNVRVVKWKTWNIG